MTKILISEHIPSLNKGELTILEGMLETFKILGETEVTIVSCFTKTDRPRYRTNIRLIDPCQSLHLSYALENLPKRLVASFIALLEHVLFMILFKTLGLRAFKLMRAKIWQAYADCDVVIAGHDGGFGPWGDGFNPLYLYPFYTLFLARVLGKPVVIYGASAPKIKRLKLVGKFLTRLVLNKADLLTMREKASAEYLKSIGVTNDKLSVTADPAFLMQPAPDKRVMEIMNREGLDNSRVLIGMTITREIASQAFPSLDSENSYRKHTEMLAQVVDHLIDNLNAMVVFVPHCLGTVKEYDERDDRIIAKDILQICHHKDMVKIITNEYGPAELKGLMGRFTLFLGERLHSVINAMGMYVPSIAISWPEDVRFDIIRMLGREEAICSVQDLQAVSLIDRISDIWEKRDMIREQLVSQVEIIRERAMVNGKLLKELLDSKKQVR